MEVQSLVIIFPYFKNSHSFNQNSILSTIQWSKNGDLWISIHFCNNTIQSSIFSFIFFLFFEDTLFLERLILWNGVDNITNMDFKTYNNYFLFHILYRINNQCFVAEVTFQVISGFLHISIQELIRKEDLWISQIKKKTQQFLDI